MRIGPRNRAIIEGMERAGYVWLTHLGRNAQMRFRNRTRTGFDCFIKINGLTFLTKRIAAMMEKGTKTEDEKRMTYKEQVLELEKELYEMELDLYDALGVGVQAQLFKYSNE